MGCGVQVNYARRLSVGLVSFGGQEIFANAPLPYGSIILAAPAMQPRLHIGEERAEGQIAWLLGLGYIINGKRYRLEKGEGILAKIKYGEAIPLITAAPYEVIKATQALSWPIVKRYFMR